MQLVGLIQEQHADRCALFLQWKQMDFPVLVDTLNRTQVAAVPLLWALDEYGIVRAVRPDFEWFANEFLDSEYSEPESEAPLPDADPVVDAFLDGDFDHCVDEWTRMAADGSARDAFLLGCAHRARYDTEARQSGDFQQAIAAWTLAVERDPNQYIFRRRLQQYGPDMEKPYPFYDWVEAARREIRARGEDPVPLSVEPAGAELAQPARQFREVTAVEEPDPDARIDRDAEAMVVAEAVVAPWPVTPGESARITVELRPSADVHWTNDAGALHVVLSAPEHWRIDRNTAELSPRDDTDVSTEVRRADFQVMVPEGASGETTLQAYALYYVCRGEEGECVYRRQDVQIPVVVGEPESRRE